MKDCWLVTATGVKTYDSAMKARAIDRGSVYVRGERNQARIQEFSEMSQVERVAVILAGMVVAETRDLSKDIVPISQIVDWKE